VGASKANGCRAHDSFAWWQQLAAAKFWLESAIGGGGSVKESVSAATSS